MNFPQDSAPIDSAAGGEEVAAPQAAAPPRRRALRRLLPILLLAGLFAVLWTPVVRPYGRQSMVLWNAWQAERQLLENELDGALASAEKSVEWAAASLPQRDLAAALATPDEALNHSPKLATALRLRGVVRQARHDLEGSLADYNALIAINPHVARSYLGRATVLQRLGRHREAIDDASAAVELQVDGDPEALNARAYTRAIASLELEEALRDVERAIAASPDSVPNYLDTRGYILYLLDRPELALADMDRAILLVESATEQRQEQPSSALQEQAERHALAVMLHHRGLIHEKLGHAEQAEADLRRGQELGYDPEKGVF